MLVTDQIIMLIKDFFKDHTYGDTLKEYISKHNPKTTADIESLERRWLYSQNHHTGGGQWL